MMTAPCSRRIDSSASAGSDATTAASQSEIAGATATDQGSRLRSDEVTPTASDIFRWSPPSSGASVRSDAVACMSGPSWGSRHRLPSAIMGATSA